MSKLDYIHLSPVRAGIVEKAAEYIYSSANNYINDIGILTVEKIDIAIVDVLKKSSIEKYIGY